MMVLAVAKSAAHDPRKAIFAACKALGLSAEERHDVQRAVTGKTSLTDMTPAELERLREHLNRRTKGPAKPANEWSFVFKLTADRQPYGKKIFRLAERMGALQTPPVPVISKAYLEGISAQMRGTTQPLEFCDAEQLHKLVQALEVYLKRHEPKKSGG